jgi:chorismate mutase
MPVLRGLRGATTVPKNEADDILQATAELLAALVAANDLQEADVASILFTATPDLDAAYPAVAARQLGWTETALLCVQEMAVPGSLPRCIRILIHWNTALSQDQLTHVYLREARKLRPDRVQNP